MTNIRRYPNKGNIYFLTHVTFDRKPILVSNFDILWAAMERVRLEYPFELMAWVVIPDHLHIIIDPLDNDISKLMRKIKLIFSWKYRRKCGWSCGRVWQYRFWDHIIRDQNDLNRHIDYVHFNPVKHGLVYSPTDYMYSSFYDYFKEGIYTEDWGLQGKLTFDGDFGE